jgi:hypothetical protein
MYTSNLLELLYDPSAYGTVLVRPGFTVAYDHHFGDYFNVAIDGERRSTDMPEDVHAWITADAFAN